MQVILTSLLKVYVKGGLFDKSRELLDDLDALGYAQNEVHIMQSSFTQPAHNEFPPSPSLQCSSKSCMAYHCNFCRFLTVY